MQNTILTWSRKNVPEELHPLLRALAEEYTVTEQEEQGCLHFRHRSRGLLVRRENKSVFIEYGSVTEAARGVGALLADLVPDSGEIREESSFRTFGVMFDCSRNAVMTVEYAKKWLRRLALLGYNFAMLYTKDTFRLPDEDYFGYLRGRYTLDELRAIDDYAAAMGIEMAGCIQTLGHLEPVLRWSAYNDIKDTSSVVLTTEKKTYHLIDKMLDFYSSAFRSRRIHIGMDETFDLGRGRHMDLNGYTPGFEIFNRHLKNVTESCDRRGLQPMIWSDMYFRLGSRTQDYYDRECVIPENVKKDIPRSVDLVYWDYYHENAGFYAEWIRRHRELGFDPVMASGVWTWAKLCYNHTYTERRGAPCIDACIQEKVKDIFFTMWADNGASYDLDSAAAGLAWCAEMNFANGVADDTVLSKRCRSLGCGDFRTILAAGGLTDPDRDSSGIHTLWDDPLLGVYWKNQKGKTGNFWVETLEEYTRIAEQLHETVRNDSETFTHLSLIAEFLCAKIRLKLELDRGIETQDTAILTKIRDSIPDMMDMTDSLLASYRNHWMERYKPFGFEFIQIRLGGQKERFRELQKRLGELISGTVSSIPELEEIAEPSTLSCKFENLATGSYFV